MKYRVYSSVTNTLISIYSLYLIKDGRSQTVTFVTPELRQCYCPFSFLSSSKEKRGRGQKE